MSANLDRFSFGYTPREPVEVGDCEACGYVIYDYELIHCSMCDVKIHQSCESKCDKCSSRGCKGENGCLIEIEGLLFCLSCYEVEYEYKYAA